MTFKFVYFLLVGASVKIIFNGTLLDFIRRRMIDGIQKYFNRFRFVDRGYRSRFVLIDFPIFGDNVRRMENFNIGSY